MGTRAYGLIVLVLSALVLWYLSSGLLGDAFVLLLLAFPAAIGAAILSLMMIAGKT